MVPERSRNVKYLHSATSDGLNSTYGIPQINRKMSQPQVPKRGYHRNSNQKYSHFVNQGYEKALKNHNLDKIIKRTIERTLNTKNKHKNNEIPRKSYYQAVAEAHKVAIRASNYSAINLKRDFNNKTA